MKNTFKLLAASICFIFSFIGTAQINYAWANSVGSTNMEYGQSIATDPSGNVYVAGSFSGTVDFDPSASTANLTGVSGSQDIFLAKYSATGAFIWVKQIAGTNTERPLDLAADASGAYLAGIFMGTIDFDPSAATNNTTSLGGGTDGDGFFAKYDANGSLVWVNRIGSTGNDRLIGIAVDASQNVFISGFIGANADMDPSAATLTFPVSGTYNAYFGKYSSTGALVFAKQITGGYSEGDDIAIDGSGNIYLTGSYATTNDFDPSASTANLSTSNLTQLDIFLAKYTSTGNYTFAKQIGGIGVDIGFQIMPDASGNIYLGGVFSNTCDFDPTASISSLTSAGQGDLFVAKYTSAGLLTWVNGTGGTTNDYCYGMGIDASNNVYITGKFQGSNIDFDPSASSSFLSATSSCLYVAGYNSSGGFLFAHSPGNIVSEARSMAVNSSLYITGFFNATGDFDFSASNASLTPVGSSDVFFAKYNLCTGSPPAQPSAISGATNICFGTTQSYSVVNDASATGYVWSFPGGWGGTSTTNTISATSGNTGLINVSATNSCGASVPSTINITVNPLPTPTFTNSSPVCSGSSLVIGANGASSYTIYGPNSFAQTAQSFTFVNATPVVSGVYTVIASSAAGCTAVAFTTVTINSQPTLIINNPSACVNGNLNFTSSGANTYTWTGPNSFSSTAQSPTISNVNLTMGGQYTLIATNGLGCTNTAISNATVSPIPNPSATSNSPLCENNNLYLTGGGSGSYFWSGPNSFTSAVQNPTINTVSLTNAGIYTLVVSANSCSSSITTSVSISPTPSVSITPSTTSICAGQSLTLTASGANTYTWSNNSNSPSIIVTPTANSSYSVSGSGTVVCSGLAIKNITVHPLPSLSAVSNTSFICVGQSATLTANGASTYTWNTSSNSTSIIVSPTITTTYTVNGTNSFGCDNSTTIVQNVSTCTGIINLTSTDQLMDIFPNPFNETLTIKGQENSVVEISNSLGQLILKEKLQSNMYTINTSSFAKGVYFIVVKNYKPMKLIKE